MMSRQNEIAQHFCVRYHSFFCTHSIIFIFFCDCVIYLFFLFWSTQNRFYRFSTRFQSSSTRMSFQGRTRKTAHATLTGNSESEVTSPLPFRTFECIVVFYCVTRASKLLCTNWEWPDKYGHYREAKYTQTKHHWFWKVNYPLNLT